MIHHHHHHHHTRPVQGIIPVSDDGISKMLDTVFSADDLFPSNVKSDTMETNGVTESDDSDLSVIESKSVENVSVVENVVKPVDTSPPIARRKAFYNIASIPRDPEVIAKEKAELQMKKEREIAAKILKKKLTSQWHELVYTNYENYLKAYDGYLRKKVAESREELTQGNTSNEPVEETPSYLRQLYNTKSFKEGRKTAYYQIDMKVEKAKDETPLEDHMGRYEVMNSGNESEHTSPAGSPKTTSKTKSKKLGKVIAEIEAAVTIQKSISFENYLLTLEVYMIYNMWVSCHQIIDIYNAFKDRDAPLDVLVRVVCILFSRIVDLENFGSFLEHVSRDVKCEIIHRLGILNVWCPMKPDGLYELDLASKDHREVLKLLISLAAIEPGQNAFIEKYFTTRVEEPKRDLEIPAGWLDSDDTRVGGVESGPPRYGHLIFKYTSDPELGCEPNIEARKEITQFRTLAGTRGSFIRGFETSLADIEKQQHTLGSDLTSTSIYSNDDEDDVYVTVTSYDTFVDDNLKKRKMSAFKAAADGLL